jgi:hypothetical protein
MPTPISTRPFDITVDLDLATFPWDDRKIDDELPGHRLGCALHFGPLSFHGTAIQVIDTDDEQRPISSLDGEDFDAMCTITGSDGPLETFEFNGRTYVCAFTPYCE